MDLSRILELAAARGSVFWIAAGAVALGAALLAASLVQYLRRRLASGWLGRLRVAGRRPTPADAAAPGGAVAPAEAVAAYLAAGSPRTLTAGTGPDEPSLALLLRRLQAAGDRLEEIAGDLASQRGIAAESFLKENSPDVEYVFKASGA